MKNLLVATIDSNDPNEGRIKIVCLRRQNEDNTYTYSWYEDKTDISCEVSAKTLDEAKIAAMEVWGGTAWNMKASWIRS